MSHCSKFQVKRRRRAESESDRSLYSRATRLRMMMTKSYPFTMDARAFLNISRTSRFSRLRSTAFPSVRRTTTAMREKSLPFAAASTRYASSAYVLFLSKIRSISARDFKRSRLGYRLALIGRGKFVASFQASTAQYFTSAACLHPLAKSAFTGTAHLARAVRTFHLVNSPRDI